MITGEQTFSETYQPMKNGIASHTAGERACNA
jgi:hypothetical protein